MVGSRSCKNIIVQGLIQGRWIGWLATPLDQNIHLYTCHSKVATNQTSHYSMNCCPTPFLYVSWSNFRFPSSIRISPAFKNCCKPLVLRPTLSLASKKGFLFRILSHRFFSKAVRWNLEWKALGQGHLISSCVWIKKSYCSWDYSIHWSYVVVRSTLCLVSFPNHKFWYSEEYSSGKLAVPSNLPWGNSVSNVSGSYTFSPKPLFLFFFLLGG